MPASRRFAWDRSVFECPRQPGHRVFQCLRLELKVEPPLGVNRQAWAKPVSSVRVWDWFAAERWTGICCPASKQPEVLGDLLPVSKMVGLCALNSVMEPLNRAAMVLCWLP